MSVDIRISGTPAEVARMAELMRQIVRVIGESGDFPNRPPSLMVRRYLRVELAAGDPLAKTETRTQP